jgi:hypothetical protein
MASTVVLRAPEAWRLDQVGSPRVILSIVTAGLGPEEVAARVAILWSRRQ